MSTDSMNIVILGLSITSSWGNGHATTWRGLVRELDRQGMRVTFLERDVPWYANSRDLPRPPWCDTHLYGSLEALRDGFTTAIREADVVIVGSFVPEGIAVGEWVLAEARGTRAFYDIDTPITLALLARDACDYLHVGHIPRYDLYLSFTGGPTLGHLETVLGSPRARALYCSVDPELYTPDPDAAVRWDLGYLGTWSSDRQVRVESLLNAPARALPQQRFVVAGAQYPSDIAWSPNVERVEHVPPPEHAAFYNAQRFTLNVTRDAMIRAGWSPSVRLFEAAACATPILSDRWPGLESLFTLGAEVLPVSSSGAVLRALTDLEEGARRRMGARARTRVLAEHTSAHRAHELVTHLREAGAGGRPRRPR